MIGGLNILAIALAAAAAIVIGGLWYSSKLFGQAWLKELGKTSPEELGSPTKALINAVAMNIISAFALALVFRWQGAETMTDALMISLVVSVGLVLSNQLMRDRFHGASGQLSLINGMNTVVTYVAMGVVLHLAG
ncbi:MAG: DUF1761 domain-containing protein [Rhodospirillaceae bacterium]